MIHNCGAFTIDPSTATLTGNLNEHPTYLCFIDINVFIDLHRNATFVESSNFSLEMSFQISCLIICNTY
jgi:hypothetical protein